MTTSTDIRDSVSAVDEGDVIEVRNPADSRDLLGKYKFANEQEIRAAISDAERAQVAWSRTSPRNRAAVLYTAAEVFEERSEELSRLLTREEGKTLTESRSELNRVIEVLRFYGATGYLLTGKTFPIAVEREFACTIREPLGIVAVITPWNFPIAIPIQKIAPALVCGNAVIFKPASQTPTVALELVSIMREAGLPFGLLTSVLGAGDVVGSILCHDSRIAGISFTGSTAVGRELGKSAFKRTSRVQLEMGGKNPLVVLEDADLDLAAELAVSGAFGNTGQSCMATSLVIVENSVHDSFLDRFLKIAGAINVGNGLEVGVQMGPKISESELRKTLDYIEFGQKEGATLAFGGKQLVDEKYKRGWYVEPTVFTNVQTNMRIFQEEIFGPVLCVARSNSLDDAITMANSLSYGLVASVCTKSLARSHNFVRRVDAGIVKINKPTIGFEIQIPFGGIKDSSSDNFKEMGHEVLDFYSRFRTVYAAV